MSRNKSIHFPGVQIRLTETATVKREKEFRLSEQAEITAVKCNRKKQKPNQFKKDFYTHRESADLAGQ